jgi:hypothetical protein
MAIPTHFIVLAVTVAGSPDGKPPISISESRGTYE